MICYFREKLDILIDEDELRDENIENIPKEACNMSGYSLLSERERKVNIPKEACNMSGYCLLSDRKRKVNIPKEACNMSG